MAPTVLVVDDDPVIIDLLTLPLTLELEGWTVLEAITEAFDPDDLVAGSRPSSTGRSAPRSEA